MKKTCGTIIIGILICLALCSCNSAEQLKETWSLSAPTALPEMISKQSFIWDVPRFLSPDGKWFAKLIETDDSMILKVINTGNPNISLESDPIALTSQMIGMRISSWSPDSSSIVAVYSTKVQAPCYDTGIFIFHLDETDEKLDTDRFEPSELDPVCAQMLWSPDGKQLAVGFNPWGFYLVSAQGEPLHTITPDMYKGSSLFLDVWTDFGLIYHIYQYSDNPSDEFRLVDPANPEAYTTHVKTTESLRIVDTNSISQNILFYGQLKVSETDSALQVISNNGSAKFFLFDVLSKTLNLVGEIPGEYKKLSGLREEKPFSAFTIENRDSDETWLWVYNWESGELTKLLQITELLGWRDNLGGFAVVTGDEQNGFDIRIISP